MITFLIIVPTRNSFYLLSNLVTSLLGQTYPYWRVHFVDGQSDRDHLEFLDSICSFDSRFSWIEQEESDGGIYGAMNEGLAKAYRNEDWVLFWGSDDRASSPLTLESIASKLKDDISKNSKPDLLVCSGTYINLKNNLDSNDISTGRNTAFNLVHSYRRSLFWGSTPPHQATFFGPGSLRLIPEFSTDLKLAADLDYFLRLSNYPNINVTVLNDNVVLIGDGGVSTRKTNLRLYEVKISYQKAFKNLWWIPFIMRYLLKFLSLFRLR